MVIGWGGFCGWFLVSVLRMQTTRNPATATVATTSTKNTSSGALLGKTIAIAGGPPTA